MDHHDPNGGFRNPWPGAEVKEFRDLLKWVVDRNTTHRPAVDPPRGSFPAATPRFGQAGRKGALAVTWFGHSSALIEFPGCNVLTDPIWSNHASPVPVPRLRRFMRPPVPLSAVPAIDVVLLSHNHYDHLDRSTVRELARLHPRAVWCVPLGLAPLLHQFGVKVVEECDWWATLHAAGATMGCTPAQHFSARGFHDRNQTLWCGWSVRVGNRAVLFAGDTGLHPLFGEIGQRFGPFDVVLLPIGAYAPRWFMQSMHMNPEDALEAYAALLGAAATRRLETGATGSIRPPVVLPIHWGTFKLTDESLDEPPKRFRALWEKIGYDPEGLWLLSHGETRVLG
ncbi:MAG: MBL fold metallo-hydrolase [Gemmatimonadales bacterium]